MKNQAFVANSNSNNSGKLAKLWVGSLKKLLFKQARSTKATF